MENDHIADDRKKVRLIDANAVLAELDKFANPMPNKSGYDFLCGVATVITEIEDAPTIDAVEVDEVREFAKDVAYQFGYYCQNGGRLHITHGGLSTLEWAFDILGWENPHPVPECECEIDGCHEHATCGAPTADGYKWMCSKHCLERRNNDG